jgi:hypothetical protein
MINYLKSVSKTTLGMVISQDCCYKQKRKKAAKFVNYKQNKFRKCSHQQKVFMIPFDWT